MNEFFGLALEIVTRELIIAFLTKTTFSFQFSSSNKKDLEVNVNARAFRAWNLFPKIFAFNSNKKTNIDEAVERKARCIDEVASELRVTKVKQEAETEMTVKTTTTTTEDNISIDELIKLRRTKHIQKAREKRVLDLNYINGNGENPLDPTRPYGLPMEMEGSRRDVWGHVFEQVDDLESISHLRIVCVMFMELLERRFTEVMLAHVMGNRFAGINDDRDVGARDRLKELLTLRKVSRFSKKSVNNIIGGGVVGKIGRNWFTTEKPYNYFRTPTLYLQIGVSGRALRRLEETLEHLKQLKQEGKNPGDFYLPFTLAIFEVPEDGLDVDMQGKIEMILEEIGAKVISLCYVTTEKSFETYVSLSRWLTYLPNLHDLYLDLRGPTLLRSWEKYGRVTLEPFTACPHLKRYSEGFNGFGVPFLKEILRANPTIQEVILGDTSISEWKSIKEALDNLQITKFHSLCMPQQPLFEQPFKWAEQLTALALWDPHDRFFSTSFDVPSKKLFTFISSCKNLRNLVVSSPHIQDTGGYLQLPKLVFVAWKLFPTFKTLEFLRDVENLATLYLDVSECLDINRKESDVLKFLGKWNIPSLYPALTQLRVKTRKTDEVRLTHGQFEEMKIVRKF